MATGTKTSTGQILVPSNPFSLFYNSLHRSSNKGALVANTNYYNPTGTLVAGTTIGDYLNGSNAQQGSLLPSTNGSTGQPVNGPYGTANGKGQWLYPAGSPTGGNAIAPATTSGAITNTSGTSGTTSSTQAPSNPVEYPAGSGVYYDLNDTTQRTNFYNAKLTDMTQSRDQQLQGVQSNLNQLGTSAQDYVKNYFRQLQGLGDSKSQGDLGRINAYTAASPNAYQSSEGDSYNGANQKYLQGVGDAAQQANRDVGANFLTNPTNLANLGAGTSYGQQYNNYETGINQIGTDYNQMLQGVQQQNDPSTNPFRSSYQAAGLQAPSAVDLSAYKPFVGFNQTVTGGMPNAQNPGAIQGNPFPTDSLSNFLGKTQLNPNDTSYLQNYLRG